MKVIRFMLGLVGYVVVWVCLTGLVTLLLHPLLPGKAPDPIGVDWAAIPGGFVGAVAGYWVYQVIIGKRSGKAPQ
jgi:predicted metal-binding membrane protein